jgi:sporulation protein YlmC with PRC-barrel domain
MKTLFHKTVIAAFLPAFALCTPIFAADPPKQSAAVQHSPPAMKSMRDMRATKLIGSDVHNSQGENFGSVKDLIIDIANDRVFYAVLSFGGFLGMGDKLFAIPVTAFRPVGSDDKVILNIDNARLKGAPGFDSKSYPNFDTPQYRTEVDGYFGPNVLVKPMDNQMLRRASDWLGKNVRDRNGKEVGEVKDIVVTMGSAKIHYAVVEFDKAWSMDDKLFPVPMKALRYTTASKDLVWDIDKSRLDAKRVFDKNKWPDINDPKTLKEIDRGLIAFAPVPSAAASGPRAAEKKQQ